MSKPKFKDVSELGKSVSKKLGKIDLTTPVGIHKDTLFFRTHLAEGSATLHDGRKVKIDACMNINCDSLLIGVSVEGEKGWITYAFQTQECVQAALADFEKRFPEGGAGPKDAGDSAP